MAYKFNPFTSNFDEVSVEDLSGYVPYTGATANVDLGSNTLTATQLIVSGGTNIILENGLFDSLYLHNSFGDLVMDEDGNTSLNQAAGDHVYFGATGNLQITKNWGSFQSTNTITSDTDITAVGSVTAGTLIMNGGSITDTTGTIDFDNEILIQSQTLEGGVTATEFTLNTGVGLRAQYKLNDNQPVSTTVIDSQGNYNGTASQPTDIFQTAGKINGCFDFTANTIVALPPASVNSVFTFAFWTYIDDTASRYWFVDDGAATNFLFQYASATALQFYLDGILRQVEPLSAGQWYWVCATLDASGTYFLYIDNVQKDTDTGITFTGLVGTMSMGNNLALTRDFLGKIDDVRIWDRVISEAERDYVFNSGNGTEANDDMVVGATYQAIGTSATVLTNHGLCCLGDLVIEGELEIQSNSYFGLEENYVGISSIGDTRFIGTAKITGLKKSVTTKTANYTATGLDDVILCNTNTFTISLPTAVASQVYEIKNLGTGIITVDTIGSATIDSDASIELTQHESISIINDGTDWWII